MDEQTILLYDAIALMRKITAEGGMFSFVFTTYNRNTGRTKGITEVKRAKLRPAAKGDDISNADYKLFYWDDYYQENRNCWQPLIMYFNGTKIVLQ
jgi:hypothetical protein